jgi:hypothetical protein
MKWLATRDRHSRESGRRDPAVNGLGPRPNQKKYAPTLECLEERLALSAASFKVGPPLTVDYGPGGVAVGPVDSGGSTRPFIAVTYAGANRPRDQTPGGVDVLVRNDQGAFILTRDDHHYLANTSTPSYPEGVVIGHFTGSGFDDLAFASDGSPNAKGSVTVVPGDGQGGFDFKNAFTLPLPPGMNPTWPDEVATTTIDNKPYLFVSDFANNRILIYKGDGAGRFDLQQQVVTMALPEEIVVGNFYNDGAPDLAVSFKSGKAISILQGDRTGHFQLAEVLKAPRNGKFSLFMTTGNFSGSPGESDLAVPTSFSGGLQSSVLIFRNQSTGSAQPFVPKAALSIPIGGQALDGIATVGLGDALSGLAVTSSNPQNRPGNSVIVLHNHSSGNHPLAFRKGKVIKIPGLTLNDLVTTPNGDLVVAALGSDKKGYDNKVFLLSNQSMR